MLLTLPERSSNRRHDLLLAGLLFFLTLAAYARAIGFEFVGFDDARYVYENSEVFRGLSWTSIRGAFTGIFYTNYSPLLILTELTVSSVFGPTAAAFHGTNVLLHAINAVLVYAFLRQTSGTVWLSAAATAAWAWHPLRVESVAWVSELKDELCGLFWLLTLLVYLPYARRPTLGRYVLVVLGTAAALASKPMAVSLPLVLLLLDVYPLRRLALRDFKTLRVLILEKIPLLALSAVWSVLTARWSASPISISAPVKLANALVSIASYLRDTLLPRRLAAFYPHPAVLGRSIAGWQIGLSTALIVAVTAAAVWLWRKGHAGALVGWAWFLVTLIPVIGITQGNEISRADRYTYLPTLGLFAALVWTLSTARVVLRHRVLISTGIAALLCVELVALQLQLNTWRTTESLFNRAMKVTNSNFVAAAGLANVNLLRADYVTALMFADESLRMKPFNTGALYARMVALKNLHRDHDAMVALRQALSINPTEARFYLFGGEFMVRMKKFDQSERMYARAVHLEPANAVMHEGYGDLLAQVGRLDDAAAQWRLAGRLDPTLASPHASLGKAASLRGERRTAIAEYGIAVACAKTNALPEWRLNLAWLEATSPESTPAQIDDALLQAQLAVPDKATATPLELDTLAAALARTGQFDAATGVARTAADRAAASGNTKLEANLRSRMNDYSEGRPYINSLP